MSASLAAIALGIWLAGSVGNEGVATVGSLLTALWAIVHVARGSLKALDLRGVLVRWWPIWAFIAWALIAPLLGGHLPTPSGVARTLDWATLPAAALAVAVISPVARDRLLILGGVLFAISCLFATLQHFGLWPPLEAFEGLRWLKLTFARVYEPAGRPDRFMAGGLFFHRLKFAHGGGLVTLVALCIGLRTHGWRRVFALSLAAAGAVTVSAFTLARASAGALAVALPVALALAVHWKGRLRWVPVLAAVAMVAVVVIHAPFRQRFMGALTAEGSGDRDRLVTAGVRAVKAHPLVGMGAGRFRPGLFTDPDAPDHIQRHPGKAHNQLLSIAAEGGIVAAILFAVMLAWLFLRLRATEGAARSASLSVLLYFVLLCFVHDPLYHPSFSVGLVLVLGAALGLGQARSSARA